jgi:hypothetical protein
MPRFYFDFHHGETAIDEEGADFASIDIDRQEVVFALGMPSDISRTMDLASW